MLSSPISDQEEQRVIHASNSPFQVVKFNSLHPQASFMPSGWALQDHNILDNFINKQTEWD